MTPACLALLNALTLHPALKGKHPWTERRECMIEAIMDQTADTHCPPLPAARAAPPPDASTREARKLRPDHACLARLKTEIGRALDRAHAAHEAAKTRR
jgi:hypothetical protein